MSFKSTVLTKPAAHLPVLQDARKEDLRRSGAILHLSFRVTWFPYPGRFQGWNPI